MLSMVYCSTRMGACACVARVDDQQTCMAASISLGDGVSGDHGANCVCVNDDDGVVVPFCPVQ